MDPDATLREFVEGLRDLQEDLADSAARERTVDSLHNLATWLERGGFPPSSSVTLGLSEEGER